jgi:hypothetical protein
VPHVWACPLRALLDVMLGSSRRVYESCSGCCPSACRSREIKPWLLESLRLTGMTSRMVQCEDPSAAIRDAQGMYMALPPLLEAGSQRRACGLLHEGGDQLVTSFEDPLPGDCPLTGGRRPHAALGSPASSSQATAELCPTCFAPCVCCSPQVPQVHNRGRVLAAEADVPGRQPGRQLHGHQGSRGVAAKAAAPASPTVTHLELMAWLQRLDTYVTSHEH